MTHSLGIRTTPVDGGVAANVDFDQEARATVHLAASVPVSQDVDAWLAPGLLLAMASDLDLHLGAADPIAVRNALRARDLLANWFPNELNSVEIRIDRQAAQQGIAGRGVGCFFSGGVDSFYSAIENADEITHLVFVHGFDIDLSNATVRAAASRAAQAAAAALGKTLIEVETDIRQISDSRLPWGTHFHGAAMALVGHALSDHLRKVIIPASYYHDDLFPWGSHPELDPLWSGSRVEFVHHGEGSTRPQKVASIAERQVALDHLRVCWKNPGGSYNCGQCEKCIRTMVNLRAAGALGRCRTLPASLDLQAFRSLPMDHGARVFARENIAALRASGVSDPDLERALQRRIRRTRARAVASRMRTLLPRRRA